MLCEVPLNKEQQAFAADHHGLVYKFLNENRLPEDAPAVLLAPQPFQFSFNLPDSEAPGFILFLHRYHLPPLTPVGVLPGYCSGNPPPPAGQPQTPCSASGRLLQCCPSAPG